MRNNELKIKVVKGGPLMVEGKAKITKSDGELIRESEKVFLCRCGSSSNKPFCDGTHNKIKFD